MKFYPKGGGFDTKMLDFHLRIFGFQSLSPPFYHHLVEPSATQDILEVREGPQAHTVVSPVLPPCSLPSREGCPDGPASGAPVWFVSRGQVSVRAKKAQ